ncbi:MAG: glycosyltransferase [Desulfobacterales bacterium]|nr:glycosyltransferase [Desulfobacterales bacterium]
MNRPGEAHLPDRPGRRPRLAFFCRTGNHFLGDIIDHLNRDWDLQVFKGKSVAEMAELMGWCDVAWFEWCDEALVKASGLPKTCRIVCRLHSFEAFTDVPAQVAWEKVDALIFVAPHIREIVTSRVPDLARRVATPVVYNGVDLDRFAFCDRQPGFDIASVGYINHKKNPSLLLQCLSALVDRDGRFCLHVAGVHQERRFELYMNHMIREMGLTDHVVYHGWVEDVPVWMADKHFLISTSVFESFGYAIAEAMATGIKPLIHNFPGASSLYPRELLFNTVSDCVNSALSDDYTPVAYRRFIEENYRLEFQLRGIDRILLGLR